MIERNFTTPRFSIVIPSYLHLDDCLRPCLESVVKFTDLSACEVIVVLNGCGDDGSREFVESLGPPFRCVWLDEPSGYTHSTNVGIQASQGEYVVFLNNDVVLLEQPKNQWLDVLAQPFLSDPKMAVTGPLKLTCPEAEREFIVFFCAMTSRKAINALGALDEIFSPGYGEDCDYALRAVDAGWKIAQVPEGVAKLADKGCEDLPEWKRAKMWIANFPLYHDGNKTFGSDPTYEGLIQRNSKILAERYGSKVNTERAKSVEGWFAEDEIEWIAHQTRSLPAGAIVVEVGSWKGRSSRAIADNLPEGAKLWCCDTWNGSSGEPDAHLTAKNREGDDVYMSFYHNLHDHLDSGKVIAVRMSSAHAAETMDNLRPDMIFLDGDHSAEGIKTDVEAWLPLLKEGGLLCGHDYYKESEGPWWVHVRQFVEATFPNVEKAATSIWHVRPEIKRTVVDCFPFNDELLLLETRLNELNDVVDRWIITEAPLSHSGQGKPLYLKESLEREPERWAKWLPRITHIIVDDFDHVRNLTGSDLHWAIERHQRDSIMRGLTECKDSDIIIISDTDEIPKASAVASYDPAKGLSCLEMKLYYGSMNCEGVESWRWTRMLTYGQLKTMSPCQVRYTPNYEEHQVIKDGGWHFSFQGGPDEWVKKLESTPHQEYNKPEFKDKAVMLDRVTHGRDLLGRDIPYRLVGVDDSFPKFITENLERFKESQFIMHPEAYQFVAQVKAKFPQYFTGKKVLEVGSLIINGTVRDFFTDCDYTGIDLQVGPGVNQVAHVVEHLKNPFRGERYDVVISSEALEHDEQWSASLTAMKVMLRPGGILIVTCAAPNRPEHGTKRTDTYSSPFTTDYYRNISAEDFQGVLPMSLWADAELSYGRDGEDLYFYGIKPPPTSLTELINKRGPIQFPTITASFVVPPHSLTVTASVSTKDRETTTLPMCIAAILNQTHKPDKLIIYDDGAQKDLREISPFTGLFKLADDLGIKWEIFATPRKGQVTNHQHCLDTCETTAIWRVDDDEIPEPTCLENLLAEMKDGVGAVAGLVHHPGSVGTLPASVNGSLNDIAVGMNVQWFDWNGQPREVEHLYSSFLLSVAAAREAGGYPVNLSPVGHHEESILSHNIKRAGYKLIVTPFAKTYHLRESTGGIRSFNDHSLWEHDERIWQDYLRAWGVVQPDTKLIVLDCGLGDTLLFKGILPDLRRKFPDRKYTLAVCYPSVFDDVEGVSLISIADAKLIVGERYEDFSLYAYAWKHGKDKQPIDQTMREFWG